MARRTRGFWGLLVRADLLFWSLVIGSLFGASVYLAGLPNADFLEPVRSAQMLVYIVVFACGLIVAAAGRLLLRGGAETARHSVLWIAVMAIGFFAYDSRAEIGALYDRIRGNVYPSVALSTAEGEAEVRRTWDGHYRVEAEINGGRTRLLIDTGASMVLLPYEAIGELGIDADALEFTAPVTTANGKSTVAPITLARIKIGPIEVDNVPAAVAHPGRLKIGLLGMSFLERLTEASFQGDRLVLRK